MGARSLKMPCCVCGGLGCQHTPHALRLLVVDSIKTRGQEASQATDDVVLSTVTKCGK